jgi:hypothetical protein
MRNKITYTVADAAVFLALCQRMERTFIPTGSRVYACEMVKDTTDYDFIVAPYLWQLGEPMREFLRACNGGAPASVEIVPICNFDPMNYASDPFFNIEEWQDTKPVKDDDFEGVVYVTGGGVTVNLIFTASQVEFEAWQHATNELKDSLHDYRSINLNKAYRVRRFKELRDGYMAAVAPLVAAVEASFAAPC